MHRAIPAQLGTDGFNRQADRFDGKLFKGEEVGDRGIQRVFAIGVAIIAANVQEGLHIKIAVESAWDAIFFDAGDAGEEVRADLVGFKKRPQLIVLPLRQRIIFVIVAFAAIERHSEHGFEGVLDGFIKPAGAVELEVLAGKEAGGPQALGIGRMQFVGCQHVLQHLVVTGVFIQRLDDPVAPVPDVFLRIADFCAEAPPVAVAPDVHPVSAPAFAVLRRCEEPIDDPSLRSRRWVRQKLLLFFECRG